MSISGYVQKNGRLPQFSIEIFPLETKAALPAIQNGRISSVLGDILKSTNSYTITKFISYEFDSSIVVPVDVFTFSFNLPDAKGPVTDIIREGDIVSLYNDNVRIATGIIDTLDIDVDSDTGERITVSGRDLMAQLEDQDAISINNEPLFGQQVSVQQGVNLLLKKTRIPGLIVQDVPELTNGGLLFATVPGESKLAALQRFLEPLNCLAWMRADGFLVIGKPNMSQDAIGTVYVDKYLRRANALSMGVTHSSANIPNIMVPMWTGQELTVSEDKTLPQINNPAFGPDRLRRLGHLLPKCIVTSAPQGFDAQGLAGVNTLLQVGGQNFLQAYAKREMARLNMGETTVRAVMPGHFTETQNTLAGAGVDAGFLPITVDTVYNVHFPQGGVQNKKMYLYHCNYSMKEGDGPLTTMTFCNLGTIVADTTVAGA